MNSDKVNLKFIKALSNDMKIEIINQQNEIKNTEHITQNIVKR